MATTKATEAEPRMTMSYQPGFLDRTTISLFKFVNNYVPWYKLPGIIGAFNLSALRVSGALAHLLRAEPRVDRDRRLSFAE